MTQDTSRSARSDAPAGVLVVFGVVLLLCSGSIAFALDEYEILTVEPTYVVAASYGFLALTVLARRARAPFRYPIGFAVVALAGIVLAAARDDQSSLVSAVAWLALTLLAIWSAGRLSVRELKLALVAYPLVDLPILLTTLVGEVNPNALAARVAAASLVAAWAWPTWVLRLGVAALALGVAVWMESRTAATTLLIALAWLGWVSTQWFRWYHALGFLLLPVVLLVLLNSQLQSSLVEALPGEVGGFLTEGRRQTGAASIHKRDLPWTAASYLLRRDPLTGIGFAREEEAIRDLTGQKLRAHSAYLSIALAVGIPAAISGVFSYIAAFLSAARVPREQRQPSFALLLLGVLAYLFLAGLVESAGLFSLNTPANVLFMLLLPQVQWRRDGVSRRSRMRIGPVASSGMVQS